MSAPLMSVPRWDVSWYVQMFIWPPRFALWDRSRSGYPSLREEKPTVRLAVSTSGRRGYAGGMRTSDMRATSVRDQLDTSPPDDPRGDLGTITSGRSEWTPFGVFFG